MLLLLSFETWNVYGIKIQFNIRGVRVFDFKPQHTLSFVIWYFNINYDLSLKKREKFEPRIMIEPVYIKISKQKIHHY